MAKQIVRVITDCSQCPNADHKGGFAQIAFVPYCSQAERTIPYMVSVGPRGRAYASAMEGMPKLCLLDEHVAKSPLQS